MLCLSNDDILRCQLSLAVLPIKHSFQSSGISTISQISANNGCNNFTDVSMYLFSVTTGILSAPRAFLVVFCLTAFLISAFVGASILIPQFSTFITLSASSASSLPISGFDISEKCLCHLHACSSHPVSNSPSLSLTWRFLLHLVFDNTVVILYNSLFSIFCAASSAFVARSFTYLI